MSIGEVFKGFVADTWYKALVYLGGVALLLSLFLDVKGITNVQLQLLAAGFLLVGIGEWENHVKEQSILPSNAYTGPALLITRRVWHPSVFGVFCDLLGITSIVIGVRAIFF